jgi:hypothetical protein
VLLAEKRTALASLRIGIAVFALPLSVLSALIATSRYYSIEKVMPLLAPLTLLNLGDGRAAERFILSNARLLDVDYGASRYVP